MPLGKTSPTDPHWAPPIPREDETQMVRRDHVPAGSSLRYIFETVMRGESGGIGWDQRGDYLVLYMEMKKKTGQAPTFGAGDEVWVVFEVREDM